MAERLQIIEDASPAAKRRLARKASNAQMGAPEGLTMQKAMSESVRFESRVSFQGSKVKGISPERSSVI